MTQTPPSDRTALIGIGSNLAFAGQAPERIVRRAARSLGAFGPVRLSALYDSPAWPDPEAPAYVNAVAAVRTALSPEALLAACRAIEAGFARRRGAERYGPRTLDLDVLAVGQEVRTTSELTLPHPRIAERDFVLMPLAEVAPWWRHPVTGRGPAGMIGALAGVTATPRTGA